MSEQPRLRIFIFDDDPAITRLLQIMLSHKGHHVRTFPNPTACPVYNRTACTCPQDLPCADVIITDIMMPHMSGIDMLALQKAHGCKALAANKALLSASVNAEIQQAAADLGCHFLKKPFRINEVLDWLEECAQRLPANRQLADLEP
jgi:CheY-like chemotaxis protein